MGGANWTSQQVIALLAKKVRGTKEEVPGEARQGSHKSNAFVGLDSDFPLPLRILFP